MSPVLSNNDDRKWRVCFCVSLIVLFLFAGAAKSSAQDLGALSRQEQTRKAAQPDHAVHVYTNDDLARPRILVPEEHVNLEPARRKLPPSLVPLAPAAEPELQEVSLGEVARKYREEKLARQSQPLEPTRLANLRHVYTNDDMARPKILTPEDDARYLAALKRPVPNPAQLIVPAALATETENESALSEESLSATAVSETPLGDIARASYQQLHPPEPVFSARGAAQSRHAWRGKLVAYRTSRPVHPAPRIYLRLDLPEWSRVEPQSDEPANRVHETFTVRSGDSLWKLARAHFGRGVQWRELLASNPWIKNPNRLKIGAQIRI